MIAIVRKGKMAGLQGTVIDWDDRYFKVVLEGDVVDEESDSVAINFKANNLLFTLDTIDKIMHDPKSRQLNINYKPKIDYTERLLGSYYMRFAERPEQYEAPSLPG